MLAEIVLVVFVVACLGAALRSALSAYRWRRARRHLTPWYHNVRDASQYSVQGWESAAHTSRTQSRHRRGLQ